MENELFRKNSLERITSPDQLNEYIKVMGVRVWVIVVALFVALAGGIIWGLTGSIPETVELNGLAYAREGRVEQVYCFVPLSAAKRLAAGMEVQVSPDYAPREEYGFIKGRIAQVGEAPVSQEELAGIFAQANYLAGLLPQGNEIMVQLKLTVKDNNLVWSSTKGQGVDLSSGSLCQVLVIIRERKPYELLF